MAIEDLYINDISGASLGVWLEKAPPVVAAKERGEFVEIAGRHGEAWRGDGAYAGYDLECEIYVPETCDLTAVLAWLRGAERVRWGAHPWEVRVSAGETQVELAEWEENTDCGWLATVTWHAEPFRYVWPHAQAIQCANPQVIVNPCGAAAAPRITITGHGDIFLTLGVWTVSLEDLTDGVVIDCAEKTALTPDLSAWTPARLTMARVDGDAGRWPLLDAGATTVAWTGSASVTIAPEWRDV